MQASLTHAQRSFDGLAESALIVGTGAQPILDHLDACLALLPDAGVALLGE